MVQFIFSFQNAFSLKAIVFCRYFARHFNGSRQLWPRCRPSPCSLNFWRILFECAEACKPYEFKSQNSPHSSLTFEFQLGSNHTNLALHRSISTFPTKIVLYLRKILSLKSFNFLPKVRLPVRERKFLWRVLAEYINTRAINFSNFEKEPNDTTRLLLVQNWCYHFRWLASKQFHESPTLMMTWDCDEVQPPDT